MQNGGSTKQESLRRPHNIKVLEPGTGLPFRCEINRRIWSLHRHRPSFRCEISKENIGGCRHSLLPAREVGGQKRLCISYHTEHGHAILTAASLYHIKSILHVGCIYLEHIISSSSDGDRSFPGHKSGNMYTHITLVCTKMLVFCGWWFYGIFYCTWCVGGCGPPAICARWCNVYSSVFRPGKSVGFCARIPVKLTHPPPPPTAPVCAWFLMTVSALGS